MKAIRLGPLLLVGCVLGASALAATPADKLVLQSFRISDVSGDGDGYPDTNETVDLFVTVRNKSPLTLTNVQAVLGTTDPKIECVATQLAALGSLAPNASIELPTAFRFKVRATADRSGAVPPCLCVGSVCSNGTGGCVTAADCVRSLFSEYAATFALELAASELAGTTEESLRIELDLNSTGPAAPTATFVEGFEAGFSTFMLLNLDENLATNALSNGKRCQYNDPDFAGSNSYGETECFLGFAAGQPSVNDWHVEDAAAPDGGRAFLGNHSLHYGVHTPGFPGLETYDFSQMDAVRSKSPLNLAARVCGGDPSVNKRACNSAADCVVVGGGACVSANPELSFKQQVSTLDVRSSQIPPGQAIDRAVVEAQINVPGAVWQKLAPYVNVYNAQGTDFFTNCMFDPSDDGNDEDSYFDPEAPSRRLGPSSTCYPEFVFSDLGDTDAAFGAANIGAASDGPGLQGALGIGTWVESKFDLSRYRGRPIRIRYLITTIKVDETHTVENLFHWNPNPGDDGWWIDDVRVTQTTGASSPTVRLDTIDNSALPSCACQQEGEACSTGNVCVIEACVGGDCTTQGPVSCGDSDPCTTDGCAAGAGCFHQAVSCDDGSNCTDDSCNATTGACGHVATSSLCVPEVDAASGAAGTITGQQSFSETRAVDVTLSSDCSVTRTVEAMTLQGLYVGGAPATVGARIYDAVTTALLASADTTVGPGNDQSVTLPIGATLAPGGHYRIGFFVGSGSGNSGKFFQPSDVPYTDPTGTFVVNQAYSVVADAFPNGFNIFVPRMIVHFGPAPEANDGIDNQCAGQAGSGLLDEVTGASGFHTPGDDQHFSWSPQPGATAYQVVWSSDPAFASGCTVFQTSQTEAVIPDPPLGTVFLISVRSTAPHVGSWGADSAGDERSVPCAPAP